MYNIPINIIKVSLILLLPLLAGKSWAQNKPVSQAPLPAASAAPPPAYTNIRVNYVRTWEPNAPYSDSNLVKSPSRTIAEVKQATQYFDGLGRPVQTVTKGSSISQKDLVAPVIYDVFGREQYQYLPYVPKSGNTNDGKLKMDPFSSQRAFYRDVVLNPGIGADSIYYGQTIYEASPLNRVLSAYAPGNNWAKEGGNRPVQYQYLINTAADSVRIWDMPTMGVIPTSASGRIYGAGQLYENVTIDEAGNQVVEYKDREDKMILKKVQVSGTPGTAHAGWLCTYYVYDNLNNLRFVIPPTAVAAISGSWSISTAIAAELCFIYRYDDRNRMIVKKVPGADSTEMVYDVRDRLVFSRDGNLKLRKQWMTTFYDGLNRPLMTALYANTTATRASLQTSMNAATASGTIPFTFPGAADLVLGHYDGSTLYQASNSIILQDGFDSGTAAEFTAEINTSLNNGSDTIIATNPLPNIPASALTPLTYTYYDDYSYSGKHNYVSGDIAKPQAGSNSYAETLPAVPGNMTRGKVTGSKVRVMGTDQWLTTTTYYNDKGRVIQTIADNVSGGKDIRTNLYDFSGKLLSSYLRHKNLRSGAVPSITMLTMLQYDHEGRLLTIKKRLNDSTSLERTIVENTYDELGQMKEKRLGVSGAMNHLEKLVYEYNVRGWLKGINKGFANTAGNTASWFGQELSYDYGFISNQYNGNIGGTKWKSRSDGIARAYGYGYDKANRLTIADFTQQNSGSTDWTRTAMDFSVSNLAYDANGNIATMTQKGMSGITPRTIDQLNYSYQANSNKLMAVSDTSNTASAKLGDFINGNNTGNDYAYDTSGNLVKDLNKNIALITYNHLNLPDSIAFTGKGYIRYLYDAAGNKLRKLVVDNTTPPTKTTITDYIGDLVYENDTLVLLSHEEGRIRTVFQTGQPIKYVYDYFVKDHLGSVRMVLTEQTDFSMYTATMEPENAAMETALFSNIESSRSARPAGYPESQVMNGNEFVAKLNAKDPRKKIGPSLVLKVMAGDTIEIGVRAFYKSIGPQESKSALPAADMAAALMQAFGNTGIGTTGQHGQATIAGNNTPFSEDFISNQYQRLKEKEEGANLEDRPKAYLNFVLFDEQFNLVTENSGARQVKAEPDQVQPLAQGKMPIEKSGFLYVYTSNESQQDVYFDDVTVLAITGPLLEETHYYPFGLTMAGISAKAPGRLENRYKYNGIELNRDLDLNSYEALYRNLDPQTGRFWQVDPETEALESYSPYESMGNNPVNNTDPLGDFRTRFGAWLHSVFHGGEVHQNEFKEWYVQKTETSMSDGVVTVNSQVTYGKGRHALSRAGEDMLDGVADKQLEREWTKAGIWDPNLSPQEAGKNALNMGLGTTLPSAYIKPATSAANATRVANTVTSKTLPELQAIAKQNAPLFRKLFGTGKEGAQAVLNNIKNVKVPEGLTKEAMQAYRELIKRVPDPAGTQAIRAKILDQLLK